jgi:hypothetical protein
LAFDLDDHMVVSDAGDDGRRFFNLQVEALCGVEGGDPFFLGSKW